MQPYDLLIKLVIGAPGGNLFVVAGKKRFGDPPFFAVKKNCFRFSINRIAAFFLLQRRLFPKQAGNKPAYRFNHDSRRQFSAGKNKIADGKLFIRNIFRDSLIYALITAANKNQLVVLCQTVRFFLVKFFSPQRK